MSKAVKPPLSVKKSVADQWVIQSRGHTVAIVNSFGEEHDKENALLLAAAPDLFQALELIVINTLPGSVNRLCAADLARAKDAIEKAKNGDPNGND